MEATHLTIELAAFMLALFCILVGAIWLREKAFKIVPLLVLFGLSGCSALRQTQFERGYNRMDKMLLALEEDKNVVDADATMAGAALAFIHWAKAERYKQSKKNWEEGLLNQ
jgi:hypothetical protein